jgi:hypothetical protein
MPSHNASPVRLLDIVQDCFKGNIVIPEFQRTFVWNKDAVEELLVSLLEGYFIGTFLFLDANLARPIFPNHKIEGVDELPNAGTSSVSPVKLILDGQQRISSVFYALYEPPIPLASAVNPYEFFLDLKGVLNEEWDLEDAVIGISRSSKRQMRQMQEKIDRDEAIPFSYFHPEKESAFGEWIHAKQRSLTGDNRDYVLHLYSNFRNFSVPVITLPLDTNADEVVSIFERINRTGARLSLFDLAVAKLYSKGVLLRELWQNYQQENEDVTTAVAPEDLLRIIALIEGQEPRKGVLLSHVASMGKTLFHQKWAQATSLATRAYHRLSQPGVYGALAADLIPYQSMIVPLAAILNTLDECGGGEDLYQRIDRWYWGSVFSQRYSKAAGSRSHRDYIDLSVWMHTDVSPNWLEEVKGDHVDLETAEASSAVYKGVMCLTVLEGAKDFYDGQSVSLSDCDKDHIFPKAIYGDRSLINSILNMSLLSTKTNQARKGARCPYEYLPILKEKHGNDSDRLKQTFESHLISSEALRALKDDDFDEFIRQRGLTIRKKISKQIQPAS